MQAYIDFSHSQNSSSAKLQKKQLNMFFFWKDHQVGATNMRWYGQLLMADKMERFRTPAELRWVPCSSSVQKKWCNSSFPKVIPCYNDFHKQFPASVMPCCIENQKAGCFRAKQWPSHTLIPSFCGWRNHLW